MIEFDGSFLLALEQQRNSQGARVKFEQYLAMLQPRPGEQILDLGCGSGAHCRAMVPSVIPGGSVFGLDVEPDAIRLAKQLSATVTEGTLTFQVADGHRLPFVDGSLDAAVCISVLAFCVNPGRVLSELRRVLRPDGRLLVVNSDEDMRIYNTHDRELGRRVMRAIADRACDPWAGRRLAHLVTSAGFSITQEMVLAEVEREFTPETGGYVFAHAFRSHILSSGTLTGEDYGRWLADLEACQEDGSYCYSVCTFACLARNGTGEIPRMLDSGRG